MKTRTNHFPAIITLVCLLAAGGGALADVNAHLDRTQVGTGDAVALTVRARDVNGAEPDLTPLESDFHVLGVSRSHRTQIINGQRDDVSEWHVSLLPRETGLHVVPALAVGAESTAPIDLQVVDAGMARGPRAQTSARQAPGDLDDRRAAVSLRAGIDAPDPYVQEQVVLTLRLESTVPIIEGAIGEPEVPGAIVERLGDDRHGMTDVDGQPVNFVERRYAVFPQQSGRLEIGPIAFEGVTPLPASARQPSRNRSRSPLDALMGSALLGDPFFDDFLAGSGSLFDRVMGPRGQAVRAFSEPLSLDVQPRPDGALGARWLPARELALVEMWPDGGAEPPLLRVGEPVDRVIAVRARGVTATQLPEPLLARPDGIKQYTQPAYEDSQQSGDEMVAIRALPTTLIPNRAGELELPAVELAWWDTEADAPRTATLPARRVTVLPGDFAQAAPAQATPAAPAGGGTPPLPEPAAPPPPLDPRWPVALALLLAGAAAAWWIAGQRRRSAAEDGAEPSPGPVSRRRARAQAERRLEGACAAGDGPAAEAALLEIGRARWAAAAPTCAQAVARRLGDAELERETMLLLSSRYAAEAANWSGDGLWTAYRRCRRARGGVPDASAQSALPALYPSA